jgi:outer membrane immunogenic protein
MKRIIAGVAVALALGIGTASADGIDKKYSPIAAPPPVYAPSWSGFYIGAGVGGAAVKHEINDFGFTVVDGLGGDGVFGTAIVGWDWQLGPKTVFGIFADYDFSDDINADALNTFGLELNHNYTWSVGARLGWLANPGTLWYLTGGYTETEFELNIPGFASEDQTFQGYFAGAGIDTRLAGNWLLRLEYRYSHYDSEEFVSTIGTGVDFEPSVHSGRATLTYKFGGPSGGYGWGSGFGKW